MFSCQVIDHEWIRFRWRWKEVVSEWNDIYIYKEDCLSLSVSVCLSLSVGLSVSMHSCSFQDTKLKLCR